jgi:hypothetical protein
MQARRAITAKMAAVTITIITDAIALPMAVELDKITFVTFKIISPRTSLSYAYIILSNNILSNKD